MDALPGDSEVFSSEVQAAVASGAPQLQGLVEVPGSFLHRGLYAHGAVLLKVGVSGLRDLSRCSGPGRKRQWERFGRNSGGVELLLHKGTSRLHILLNRKHE